MFYCTCEFLLPLLFLMLLAFLNMLVLGGFSTVADFPTDSDGHAAVEIHDVHLVPVSAVILMLMVSLL
jgi:hypothetical protein